MVQRVLLRAAWPGWAARIPHCNRRATEWNSRESVVAAGFGPTFADWSWMSRFDWTMMADALALAPFAVDD